LWTPARADAGLRNREDLPLGKALLAQSLEDLDSFMKRSRDALGTPSRRLSSGADSAAHASLKRRRLQMSSIRHFMRRRTESTTALLPRSSLHRSSRSGGPVCQHWLRCTIP